MRAKLPKSYYFLITFFAVCGVVSWTLYFKNYAQSDTVNIHKFPKEINGWQSRELPISDEDYAILETRNAFVREYSKGANKVYLFVVYSQDNRKVSHPPEICYTGGGVSILENTKDVIVLPEINQVIKVHRLLLETLRERQLAYYWFKVGDTFTLSYLKQQLLIAVKTLMGQSVSSSLIRISSPVEKEGIEHTSAVLKNFARDTVPVLVKYLP